VLHFFQLLEVLVRNSHASMCSFYPYYSRNELPMGLEFREAQQFGPFNDVLTRKRGSHVRRMVFSDSGCVLSDCYVIVSNMLFG